jgi:hypothetical protein
VDRDSLQLRQRERSIHFGSAKHAGQFVVSAIGRARWQVASANNQMDVIAGVLVADCQFDVNAKSCAEHVKNLDINLFPAHFRILPHASSKK